MKDSQYHSGHTELNYSESVWVCVCVCVCVCAAREAAMWELEERHLQEKHQLHKQQLKDQYFMQRHQLLKRHEKVRHLVPDQSNQLPSFPDQSNQLPSFSPRGLKCCVHTPLSSRVGLHTLLSSPTLVLYYNSIALFADTNVFRAVTLHYQIPSAKHRLTPDQYFWFNG